MNFSNVLEHYSDLFQFVPPNTVQSIRTFTAPYLKEKAEDLSQHFLYANLSETFNTPPVIVENVEYDGTVSNRLMEDYEKVMFETARYFGLPDYYAQSSDHILEGLTEVIYEAGHQEGILGFIEHIPTTESFDYDKRESFLDVFREASDFWAERGTPFRMFYSFLY